MKRTSPEKLTDQIYYDTRKACLMVEATWMCLLPNDPSEVKISTGQ